MYCRGATYTGCICRTPSAHIKRPIQPDLAALQPAQFGARYSPLEHWLVTVKAPVLDRKRRQTILVQTGVRFEYSGNRLQATQHKGCSAFRNQP